MISWKLWAALRKPFVAHPIYQLRGVWKLQPPRRSLWYVRWQKWYETYQGFLGFLTLLVMLAITVAFGPAPLMILLFGVPFLLLFVGLPLVLLAIGTLYGLASAAMISDSIANEQIQGRYALLGATPYGAVGASWALCSLEFHRHERMMQLRTTISSIYIMLATFLGFPIVFTFFLFIVSSSDAQTHFYDVLNWSLLILFPALDYVQSTTGGCLIGMIAPMLSKGRANARALAVSIFLSVQFATYILIAFLCLVLLPMFFYRMGWQLDVGYTALCVVIFFVCRDMVLFLLWVVLAKTLDAEIGELDSITQVGIHPMLLEFRFPMSLGGIFRRAV